MIIITIATCMSSFSEIVIGCITFLFPFCFCWSVFHLFVFWVKHFIRIHSMYFSLIIFCIERVFFFWLNVNCFLFYFVRAIVCNFIMTMGKFVESQLDFAFLIEKKRREIEAFKLKKKQLIEFKYAWFIWFA